MPFLPAFDAWQSGFMPYSWLLFCQLIILTTMFSIIIKCLRGTIKLNKTMGLFLWAFGGFYFGVMVCRLMVGLLILPNHYWFGAYIPTLFHLILAGFMLVLARFYHQDFDRSSQQELSNE